MSKVRVQKFLSLWVPVVLWAALIFRLSSGTVPVASSVFWQDFVVKKSGHVLLFGVLAILVYRALVGYSISKKDAMTYAVFTVFLYGATDEYHQLFTQGREGRLRDVFIDGIGAFVAVYLLNHLLPKFPNKIREYLLKLGIH